MSTQTQFSSNSKLYIQQCNNYVLNEQLLQNKLGENSQPHYIRTQFSQVMCRSQQSKLREGQMEWYKKRYIHRESTDTKRQLKNDKEQTLESH